MLDLDSHLDHIRGRANLANAIMEQATDIENVIDEMPDEVPDADGKSRPAAYMAG
jgi:hypothetical protein